MPVDTKPAGMVAVLEPEARRKKLKILLEMIRIDRNYIAHAVSSSMDRPTFVDKINHIADLAAFVDRIASADGTGDAAAGSRSHVCSIRLRRAVTHALVCEDRKKKVR